MEDRVSPVYVAVAFGLSLIVPALCVAYEGTAAALVKWAPFWAVGVRLGLAGLRQMFDPRFTAKEIFALPDDSALPIVRELGMANASFAALGLCSLIVPTWRVPAILVGGVYYGLAAAGHAAKKPSTKNELVALVSDILVFLGLAAAFAVGLAR